MPPLGPKLPCPVCGADDVDIVAADLRADGPGHITVTKHDNGDRCEHQTGEVSEAAWREYEARRGRR